MIFEFTRRLIRFAVARLTFMFSAQISIGTPAARYSNKALSSGVKFASCRNWFSSGTVKSYTFKMRSITPRFLLAHMAEPNTCYKDPHRFHFLQASCMAETYTQDCLCLPMYSTYALSKTYTPDRADHGGVPELPH